jgi:amidohydrolase
MKSRAARPQIRWFIGLLLTLAPAAMASAQPTLSTDPSATAQQKLASLTEIYKHLHRNPELSKHEEKTSAFLADQLRTLGYSVTERVGKYADGSQAFGIVAILQNGSGPRLLIRADMDALPLEEKTGLDYASTARSIDPQGQKVGVMHACGHDLHMTVLLGVAQEMVASKSRWRGTLMLVGQPSEEVGGGAEFMLKDGLYERFGVPDFILSEHDSNVPAGSIALKGGPMFASNTLLEVTVRGLGSHGAAPQAGKDPIVIASEFVLLAQTIVSRQINPQEPAVLTVGMFHGGTKNSIIPDEVKLGLTLRTYSPVVKDQIVTAIRRMLNGLAEANGLPADRMPIVTVSGGGSPTVNDDGMAERLRQVAVAKLGKDRVQQAMAAMTSEDVGLFTLDGKIPGVMFWLGAADPEKLAESRISGRALPGTHSPLFAPAYAPAITTGVEAMTAMALDLLR